jgi:aerobic carbon-monoxide dehydrogenase small subunit
MNPPGTRIALAFTLNGMPAKTTVDAETTAYELMRGAFELTSVRSACDGIGMCGACTILVDGLAAPSCLMLAADLAGTRVETVEGLAAQRLHPLQQAFVGLGALQCGFCTGGMLLSAKALLDETPHPSREEIRRAIAGNICRCTGYAKIVQAIEAVAAGTGS